MSDRENLVHRMAQWWECPTDMAAEALDMNFAAWKQAMAEFGVPDHPGGQCPSSPCPSAEMAELVTFRAYELLGLDTEADR